MFGFIKLQPKLSEEIPVTLPYSAVQPVNADTTFYKLLHSNDNDNFAVSINTTDDDAHHQALKKQEDSFVRQSTKYWVKSCDLAAVCTILSENLSVHAFAGGSPWTPISSVYLDNASRECYTERLRKDCGARIVRFRTYNNDTNRVFVERKVHQEKWTGEVSSKDRFAMDEDQIMLLLRGQAVRVSEKHQALNNEIQTMISDKKMFPTLRIDYTRIAFQPETHDHVRVSIDLNMRYLQERCSHMEWYTPDEKLQSEDQLLFPYSIVEIKLREPYITKPPKWLEDLEQSALLHKENNFSKYIHGTFAFSYLKGNTLKLTKPSWWENMEIMSPQIPLTSATSESEWGDNKRKLPIVATNTHWLPALFGINTDRDKHGAPIKIEPKVFFANERTFLVWFQSSLFVCSIGVALASSRQSYAVGILLIITGIIRHIYYHSSFSFLLLIGLLLIGYAALTYLQRINSLLNKNSAGYHDKFGPIMLTAIVATIFGASIGISISNAKNF